MKGLKVNEKNSPWLSQATSEAKIYININLRMATHYVISRLLCEMKLE